MKRITILLLISFIGISAFSLAAESDFPEPFYPETSFSPTSARIEAMGGAATASSTGIDSLYSNPANLAGQPFSLYLPSLTLTAYNVKNIVDSGLIEEVLAGTVDETVALSFLDTITASRGELLTTDLSVGFAGGGFGFGVNLQEKLHTVGTGAGLSLIAELNASAALGIGFSLPLVDNLLSIDAGVTARPTYTAYSDSIGASGILTTVMSGSEDITSDLLANYELAAGYALPVDVGVNVNGPVGLRLSGVLRNLNGDYTITRYSEAGAWLNELAALAGTDAVYNDAEEAATSSTFTAAVPWSVDLGLGWAPVRGGLASILNPRIAVGLDDVLGLADTYESDPNALWKHLSAGAEVKLLSLLDVRAGMNKGYLSAGVGADLLIFHVDASYYWREYGLNIGDRPIDALSVRVSLGLDG